MLHSCNFALIFENLGWMINHELGRLLSKLHFTVIVHMRNLQSIAQQVVQFERSIKF